MRYERSQRRSMLADALPYHIQRAAALRSRAQRTKATSRIQNAESCAPLLPVTAD